MERTCLMAKAVPAGFVPQASTSTISSPSTPRNTMKTLLGDMRKQEASRSSTLTTPSTSAPRDNTYTPSRVVTGGAVPREGRYHWVPKKTTRNAQTQTSMKQFMRSVGLDAQKEFRPRHHQETQTEQGDLAPPTEDLLDLGNGMTDLNIMDQPVPDIKATNIPVGYFLMGFAIGRAYEEQQQRERRRRNQEVIQLGGRGIFRR